MSTSSAPAAPTAPVGRPSRVPVRPGTRAASSAPAVPAPAPAAPGTTARPRLTAVPSTTARLRRGPFVALVVTLLATGLLGLLLLNTVLAQGAFVVYDLEQRTAVLSDRAHELTQQAALEGSPTRLAPRARRLGMVPSANPAFIRMADGAVLGVPEPAEAQPPQPPRAPAPDPAQAPAAAQ